MTVYCMPHYSARARYRIEKDHVVSADQMTPKRDPALAKNMKTEG